jgi:hypothetical protein
LGRDFVVAVGSESGIRVERRNFHLSFVKVLEVLIQSGRTV